MQVVVITAPQPFVSLERAKDHLRVDHADDDLLIDIYVQAVCAHLDGPEGWLGRAISLQTLECRLASFSDYCDADQAIPLPYPPASQVVSVTYDDSDGAAQIVAAEAYQLEGDLLLPVYGASWPSARFARGAVRIRYQAGYAIPPRPIVAAALLMIGDLYANRETGQVGSVSSPVQVNASATNLLSPFRAWRS